VEYSSVEKARAVEERQERITMDGHTLHVAYASTKGKNKDIHNGPYLVLPRVHNKYTEEYPTSIYPCRRRGEKSV